MPFQFLLPACTSGRHLNGMSLWIPFQHVSRDNELRFELAAPSALRTQRNVTSREETDPEKPFSRSVETNSEATQKRRVILRSPIYGGAMKSAVGEGCKGIELLHSFSFQMCICTNETFLRLVVFNTS